MTKPIDAPLSDSALTELEKLEFGAHRYGYRLAYVLFLESGRFAVMNYNHEPCYVTGSAEALGAFLRLWTQRTDPVPYEPPSVRAETAASVDLSEFEGLDLELKI